MLNKLLAFLIIVSLFVVIGCEKDDEVYDPIPQPPQGVYSITGDCAVTIEWAGPYDRDIAEYIVYRNSDSLYAPYTEIDRVIADDNPNLDLIYYSYIDSYVSNGETYFYAVASVDHAGQISTLSADSVYDTPRLEGEVYLYDFYVNELNAGFHFVNQSIVSASSPACDVYVDSYGDILYLNAGDLMHFRGTKIQDMGYTDKWDVIGWAPTSGWSELGYVEIILNHTYVILTDDNCYAKMRAIPIDNNEEAKAGFQWAYQEDIGNPELSPSPGGTDNSKDKDYINNNTNINNLK